MKNEHYSTCQPIFNNYPGCGKAEIDLGPLSSTEAIQSISSFQKASILAGKGEESEQVSTCDSFNKNHNFHFTF